LFVSFSEEPTVTDEKFLAVTEDTALSHIPAGTVFRLDDAPPHFSHNVHALLAIFKHFNPLIHNSTRTHMH
jgi:hypothetical protein